MRKLIIITLFLPFFNLPAKDFIIEYNVTGKPVAVMKFAQKSSASLESFHFWDSGTGCKCAFSPSYPTINEGMVDCRSNLVSRVSTDVKCSINKSKETSSYFFISCGNENSSLNVSMYCK
ncbi:MAG: hypothetical protein HQK52_22220 [Oligoflexia bacterium]|nr:hypothetical protein [Oligoflexia bacterium]